MTQRHRIRFAPRGSMASTFASLSRLRNLMRARGVHVRIANNGSATFAHPASLAHKERGGADYSAPPTSFGEVNPPVTPKPINRVSAISAAPLPVRSATGGPDAIPGKPVAAAPTMTDTLTNATYQRLARVQPSAAGYNGRYDPWISPFVSGGQVSESEAQAYLSKVGG